MRWRAWLERVAPDGADTIARAIVGLPGRPVYEGQPSTVDEAMLLASEWSIRDGHTARLAYTLDGERTAPGEITRRLGILGSQHPDVAALAERVRTELDVLLGIDWPDRPKLYLLRPRNVRPARFAELVDLPLAGEPDLVAWDLGEPRRWKAYYARDQRPPGAPDIAVLPGVTAPWVHTHRMEDGRVVDTTFHARAVEVPDVPRFAALRQEEKLVPTYVSWAGPQVTVYYQVRP